MRSRTAAVVGLVALTAACGGGSQRSAEVSRFCDRAADVDDYLNEGIDVGDVSDDDVIVGLEELTDVAPDEIFDDVDIVREAYTIAVDEGDEAVFDEPEVQDATANFADYLDRACGIS